MPEINRYLAKILMKGPRARGSKEKPGYSHYLSQSQPTGHSTCPHTSCANVPAASHGKVKGCAPILSSSTNDEFKNHSVSCWGGKRLIRLFVPSLRSVGKTLTYCWLPTDTVWGEPLPEQKQELPCSFGSSKQVTRLSPKQLLFRNVIPHWWSITDQNLVPVSHLPKQK